MVFSCTVFIHFLPGKQQAGQQNMAFQEEGAHRWRDHRSAKSSEKLQSIQGVLQEDLAPGRGLGAAKHFDPHTATILIPPPKTSAFSP